MHFLAFWIIPAEDKKRVNSINDLNELKVKYLGKKIGYYFGDKFEILGGVILILLGVKILLEGLGILIL